jgi:enamine deaminase RidA (YjgF/YER057c/UK114 family)
MVADSWHLRWSPAMTDDRTDNVTFTNPPALAPPPGYSHVVEIRGGTLVYIAGQTALGTNGELVGGNDLEAQADQVFRNLSVALASVGCTARNLVKLTVFMRDMSSLASYRKARDRFFNSTTPPAAPAITLVEVSKLFADEFLIEIEAVAAR